MSIKKSIDIWRRKAGKLRMVQPFDVFLSDPHVSASGCMGIVVTASLGENSVGSQGESDSKDSRNFSLHSLDNKSALLADLFTCLLYSSLLLVDKKITNARDLISVFEDAIRGRYPILIIAEDIEHEALATLVVNKLRGALKIAAIKAPGIGDRKSQYLDDIAIRTGERKLDYL